MAYRNGLGAKKKLQRTRWLGVGGARRICRVEDLAKRDLLRLGVNNADKPPCGVARHAPLANRKAPVDDKPRRNSADFRQKHRIANFKPVDIRLRKRKRGIFRNGSERRRANRLVREVEVPEIAYRGNDGRSAGNRKHYVINLRDKSSYVRTVWRREPDKLELLANGVLNQLKNCASVLLDKSKQNWLRNVGTAIPDCFQLLEARRAPEGENMRFVVERHRKRDGVRRRRRAEDKRRALVAKPTRHRKRRRVDYCLSGKLGPLRERGEYLKRFHCPFLS